MEITTPNPAELAGLTAKAAGSAGKAGAPSEAASAPQVREQWISALLAALGLTFEDANSGGKKAPGMVVFEGENGRQLRVKLPGGGQQVLDLKAVARKLLASQADAGEGADGVVFLPGGTGGADPGGEADEAANPLTEEQARAWLLAAGIPFPAPEVEVSSSSSESDPPGATTGDGEWKIGRRGRYSQFYRLLRPDSGQGSDHHPNRVRAVINRVGRNPANLNPVQPPSLKAEGRFSGLTAADLWERAGSGPQGTAHGKEASKLWSGPQLAAKPGPGVRPVRHHSDGRTARPILEQMPGQMTDQLLSEQRLVFGKMEESLTREAAGIGLRGSASPAGAEELISSPVAGPTGEGFEARADLKMAAIAVKSGETEKKTGSSRQARPSGTAFAGGVAQEDPEDETLLAGQQAREDKILLTGPQARERSARKNGMPIARGRASEPLGNTVIKPQESAQVNAEGRTDSIWPRTNEGKRISSGLKESLLQEEAIARPDNPGEGQPVSRFGRTFARRPDRFEQLLRPAKEPGAVRVVEASTDAGRLAKASNGSLVERAFDRPAGDRLEKSKTGAASAAATPRDRQTGDGGQVTKAVEPIGEGVRPTGQQDSGQVPAISSPRLEQVRHAGIERQLPVERLTGEVARLVRDLVAEMQFSSREDYSEMRISLKPEYLGKLQIKVAVEQGAVSAHFLAESSRVKALIESGFSQLQQELADSGFSLSQFSASVGQEDQAGFSDQPGWTQGRMNDHPMQPSRQMDAEAPVAEPVQSGWHLLGTIDVLA